MACIQRVLSASLASWVRIFVVVGSQVAAVPIYLQFWSVETYGYWLLLQTALSIVTIAEVANQNYLGYEFLKIGRLNKERMADKFCSALPASLIISVLTFAAIVVLVLTHALADVLEVNPDQIDGFNLSFVVMALTWVITGSIGGVVGRVLYPFDYYPLLAWAGTVYALISATVPVVAVALGADLVMAAIVASASNVLYNIGLMALLIPLVKRQGLLAGRVNFLEGFVEFSRSAPMALQSVFDLLRQQGVRLLLLPMAGMAPMAEFSTMRTGANFAMQGLNTITGPLMPELMHFLVARDQARTESTFAIVWLVLCGVICPAIVVVQWLAPVLFPLWTHEKIVFDPWLFGMFSLGITMLALAQPAVAVLQGNNVLREQLIISILAALVVVGGMIWLVPSMGVRGAALALLMAELTSMAACVWVSQKWLQQHGMRWPWKAFTTAAWAIPITSLGMVGLVVFPTALNLPVLMLTFTLQGIVTVIYWRHLPSVARMRAISLFVRFFPRLLRAVTSSVSNVRVINR